MPSLERSNRGDSDDARVKMGRPDAHASLECELIDRRTWQTKTEARLALFTYIEGWYNPRRRHSALGQISPARFERSYHETSRTSAQCLEHDLSTVGECVACATPPVDKSAPELTDQT